MSKIYIPFLVSVATSLLFLFISQSLFAQVPVKVISYNILNFDNPSNTDPAGNDAARIVKFRQIMDEIGADIILLQEMKSATGADALVNELNSNSTSGKTFARAPQFFLYGPSSYQLGNMLIYNSDLVQFVNQTEVPRINSVPSPQNDYTVITPRAHSHYSLEIIDDPLCPTSTTPLDVFSCHLKAGDDDFDMGSNDIADRDRRLLGAQDLMDYINAMPSNANIVVGGDFNFHSPNAVNTSNPTYNEPAYEDLTGTNYSENLVDPLGSNWERNTSAYVDIYTQSTRAGNIFSVVGNDGAPGGLDDRFDFLFIDQTISSIANNVSLVANSYETFGNPGVFNGSATDGSSPVAQQLYDFSDHYPVVMELAVTFDPALSCACSIDNPQILGTNCAGDDLSVTITFDANQGSGDYRVEDEFGNPLSAGMNLGGGTLPFNVEILADLSTGSITIPFIISSTTSIENINLRVVDINNPSCSSNLFTLSSLACLPLELNLKAFWQGPYDNASGKMLNTLNQNSLLPSAQPFNTAPWNYTGTETASAIPATAIDWALVELRDKIDPTITIAKQAGFLLEDGTLTDSSGNSGMKFNESADDYIIVLRGRNHLAVESANLVNLPNTAASPIDFKQATEVKGGAAQLIDLSNGEYTIPSGDADNDGQITINDFNLYLLDSSGLNNYLIGDFNMDKIVSVTDFNLFQNNSGLIGVAVNP